MSRRDRSIDVCLVTMPYSSLVRPSIALGLLKALLERQQISCRVLYPNLWFATVVGVGRYNLCSNLSPASFLCGEWTFAEAAFPQRDPKIDEEYLSRLETAQGMVFPPGEAEGGESGGPELLAALTTLRKAANDFVGAAASRILELRPKIVGCTSTFEQHVASVALLREIKRLDPSVVTMIGGANCEGEMGLATRRNFGWVDYVVSGEADEIIGDLCSGILNGSRPIDTLPRGVFGPGMDHAGGDGKAPRRVVTDLDSLPVPDYYDYFEELERLGLGKAVRPGLPLETSRGCWWGEASHCTFCGLNGTGMAFRTKTPERVLAEVEELGNRHGIQDFECVDNILSMSYFKTLLPELARQPTKRRIFYETKSNLKRQQVRLLADAGIRWVQPGIESLHNGPLQLMAKGVTCWANVQLLKWCREFGVRLSWNMLWGFPGEDDAWYRETAEWLELIEHLQPPSRVIRIRFDRFSPYFFKAREYGLDLVPVPAMRMVYGLGEQEEAALTYFFVTHDEADLGLGTYSRNEKRGPGVQDLSRAVYAWRVAQHRFVPPVLAVRDDGEALRIFDTRACAVDTQTTLEGAKRAVLLACEEASSESQVLARVRSQHGFDLDGDGLGEILDELRERRLMIEFEGRHLALPVHGEIPSLAGALEFPGGTIEGELLHHALRWQFDGEPAST